MPLFLLNFAANLIFVAAYSVKDVLWLRVLSISGSLVILPYYYFQIEPLWAPMMWSGAYICIHGYRAWEIFLERRPVTFGEEENRLYHETFDNLTPQQFRKILEVGEWRDLAVGDRVFTEGDPAETLTAMLSGEVEARKDDRVFGRYANGEFIGLGCIMIDAPEFCDAIVTSPARVMQWHDPTFKKNS